MVHSDSKPLNNPATSLWLIGISLPTKQHQYSKPEPLFLQAIHPYWSMHVCFGANSRLSRTLLHCNHPKEQYPCKCRSRARKAGKERRLSSGSIARVCYCALAATTLPQPVLGCRICSCLALYFSKVQTVKVKTGSVKEEGQLLPRDRVSKAGYLARQACAGNSHLRAWWIVWQLERH